MAALGRGKNERLLKDFYAIDGSDIILAHIPLSRNPLDVSTKLNGNWKMESSLNLTEEKNK